MKKQILSLALLMSCAPAMHAFNINIDQDMFSKPEFDRHIKCQLFAEVATAVAEQHVGKTLLNVKGVDIVSTSDAVQAIGTAVANHGLTTATNKDKIKDSIVAAAKVLAREKTLQGAEALLEKAQEAFPAIKSPECINKNSKLKFFLKRFAYYTTQYIVDGIINNATAPKITDPVKPQ